MLTSLRQCNSNFLFQVNLLKCVASSRLVIALCRCSGLFKRKVSNVYPSGKDKNSASDCGDVSNIILNYVSGCIFQSQMAKKCTTFNYTQKEPLN